MVEFYVGDRASGKTHHLAEWVKKGKQRKTFPLWSRVILTHSSPAAKWTEKHFELQPGQVYEFHEYYREARGRTRISSVELAIDNVELVLQAFIADRGDLKVLTTTATGVTNVLSV